ncbi:drug/metabolite transporter (DMT)-like permease [Rhodoferax ferrireducens]|uniref:Drug/metabolite transporter (DMT)-like permease n=1 Tax=Rhodoferax ferrireducens TaxID=192843 RepID=A0ABU2CET8_9BURK|nr:DMT family transporter [Rhodoferax ferrireducens]MDR7379852.1 drug/metabolite transporter (DMT)-like permease [Rhodoferax ferrireducens]
MPTTRKSHLDPFAIALLLACCMFWGFQQVLVKATMAEVPPVFQACLRFAVSSLAVAAWCRWRGVRLGLGSEPAGAWRFGLLAGALFAAEFACIHAGLQYTLASRLTVFLYSAPFWVALLLPRFVPGERLRGWQWLGLACAFAGMALALGEGLFRHPAGSAYPLGWFGDALGLLAGLLWGLTTVVIRTTSFARVAPEKQLLYQVGVSAALLPLVSIALGEAWALDFSAFAAGSLLLQALVGGFASYLAWMWMLAHYPATRMSVFVFLTPVFALLFGAWWLGEPLSAGLLAAMALVGTGIVLVNRQPAVQTQQKPA